MADSTSIFDALDEEYQRREAEAGALPPDLAKIAQTAPYVAERLARQRGWTPTKAVDPESFALDAAKRLLDSAPDTPDEDVLAIKAWAERRKGVNVVREETAARADKDMTSGAGTAFDATVVPLAGGASDATFGIPEFVARKVVAPVVKAFTGAEPATKDEVAAAEMQGREAAPFVSNLSRGVGSTAGAMTLMVPAAGAMAPILVKTGLSEGAAATVANLLAGAAHGGVSEGSVSGAVRGGVFMGGTSVLGRVFRGASPGAARYLASEAAAGGTASALSQLAAEGHVDPTRVLADGVVNALFGLGGARAAGRAKARDHVAAEVAKGREIPDIVNDDVFKAMWEEARTYPDPQVEAASTRGEFDARLAEMEASKAAIPALDPVAEAKATAAQFDARVAPEPVAPNGPPTVRFYHGGVPGDGPRWLTPSKEYAAEYAAKSGEAGVVQYVDLPRNHPLVVASREASGVDPVMPDTPGAFTAFEAPADISARLRSEPPTSPEKPVSVAPKPVAEAPAGGGIGVDVGPTHSGPSASFKAWRAVFQETLGKTGDVKASFEAAERQHPGDYRPAMTDAAARALLAEKNAKTDKLVDDMVRLKQRVGDKEGAASWEMEREAYREKNRLDVEEEIKWQETSANLAKDLRAMEATHGYLTTELGKERVRIKEAEAQARLERPAMSGGTSPNAPRQGLPASTPSTPVERPRVDMAPSAAAPKAQSTSSPGSRIDPADVALVRGAVAELSRRVSRFETPAVKVNVENFLMLGAKDGFIQELRNSEMLTPNLEAAINRMSSAKIAEIEAKHGTTKAPKARAPEANPEAPKSRALIGVDKQGKQVWEIAGRYYVKDKAGRYGTAHPEAVKEARANATPPVEAAPVDAPRTEPAATPDVAPATPDVAAPKAPTPGPRPGKAGERGALSLAPVGEFLGEVAGGVQKVFGETISRVRAYKTPAAEETARKATEAVSAAKGFRGEMGPELLAATKLSGQPVVTKLGRAATELSTPTKVPGKSYTLPTFYDAIEGRHAPTSPEQARILDAQRRLIWKSGEITEREKLPQRDASGNYAPFINRTDKVAPRITAEGYHEIIQMGPASKAWAPMVDAFADLNPNIPRASLEQHFKTMHEEMASEGPAAPGARAQAEFTREIPRVPATVEVGGQTFRLFETNPATYARRFAETRAQRLGFGKAFGYDVPGQATPVQNLRERFATETGKPQEFVNLTRELHGHAKDAPIIDPGSITGGLLRNVDRVWAVAREGLLSASAVVNAPEPLGSTQHLVGTRRLAKAIYVAFRGKSHPMNAAVDALGATTRDAINASYDPANPRGSASRMMTEVMSRMFGRKFIEEFQERVAAVGGKMMADDLQAGKGTGYDIQSLKEMGWSDADARRLAKGGGTQAEYDAISRRLPTVAVGANQSKAEKSWFQNTRVLRPLNAIASYAHTSMRSAFAAHKAFIDTMGRVADGAGLTPKERWAGTFRAFQHLTGFYVAKTLQGAAATMLGAAVGRSLGIKKAEAEDDKFDFAAKSFISSTFGGPYAATARAMFGDGNLSQISPQVAVALEALDAINANGKYRDLPLSERMAQLATRFLPVSRVMRSMAVAMGLGNQQSQDIENARAAYWWWRKKFDKSEFSSKQLDEYDSKGNRKTDDEIEADRKYRTALKSAYLDMTRGGSPEDVANKVLEAIGGKDAIGKDRKKAAESIRRRQLLTAPSVKGRLDALKSRIGADAYKNLEAHDALLEALADSVQRGG